MGKTFFLGWALWEKMTFVLACLIVLTILAGFLKLWYTHHKLRQYEKAGPQPISRQKSIIRSLSLRKGPKKQKQKQAAAEKVMVQKQRLIDQNGPKVPFGIRALESGVEVDGVWISRNNTPAGSIREPSSGSLSAYRTLTQQTNNGTETSPFGESGSIREPSQAFCMDRSISASSIGSQHPSSPEPFSSASRRYPPHSYQRYEGSSSKHFRNAHTLETRLPTGMPTDPARIVSNHSSSSGSSRGGSNGSNELPTAYVEYAPIRSSSNPAFDDALQTHRMSQVAETGRLVPRSRRAGTGTSTSSSDWIPSPLAPSSEPPQNYSLPRSQTPTPPSPPLPGSSSSSSNPFATPISEKYPEIEYPTTHTAHAQKPSIASTSSASTDAKPRRNSNTSSSSYYTRPDPTVLREVNSGFAVLKPGTLEAEAAAKESAQSVMAKSHHHQRESHSSFDGSGNEVSTRPSRKLQKKRPRGASQSSRESQSSYDAAPDLERGVATTTAGPMRVRAGARYSFEQQQQHEDSSYQ